MKAKEKKLTFVTALIVVFIAGLVTFQSHAIGGCEADIDGDGDTDNTDMLLLLCAFGECDGCPEDLDGSGVVNSGDLLILLGDYGCDTLVEPTEPSAGLEVQGFVPDSNLDLYVFRIYIQLPESTDRLAYVYRADVTPSTGSFYQHSEGDDTAPSSADIDSFPNLEWDSFVTIELAQVGEKGDETDIAPDFDSTAFNAKSNAHLDGGYLLFADCASSQGAPDKEGKVLAAQLTLENPSDDPADSIEGEIVIGWMDEFDTLHHWSTLIRAKVGQLETPCPADLDGDGMISTSDLLFLFANWGKCP